MSTTSCGGRYRVARTEVGDAGVARRLVGGGRVVEHELGDVEGVLVERRHLVLLVRAPPRRGVRAGLVVRGHVDEAQVERHRRGHHDLGVVGELDEHVQRRDVLEHVDVRVPLEEAQLGALGDPLEEERLGPLEVLGAGEAGDGERLVGVALAGEVLDRPGDHDVVLRPEPQVVDAVVGKRVVPGVAVGEHAFVDRGDHVGRQLRHRGVALAEGEHPVQVHEPEVAGVLPVVDLGRTRAERVDGDVLDRPGEVGVAVGPAEVGVDARRVRRVVDAGGELEVLVDAGLPDGFVDQAGRARGDDRRGRRAERDGRRGRVRGDGGGAGDPSGQRSCRSPPWSPSPRGRRRSSSPATIAAVAPAPAIRNRRRSRRSRAREDGSSPDCIVATVESRRTKAGQQV